MNLLTKEQQESYENTQLHYICKEKFWKEKFENKYVKEKKYLKVRDYW